MAIGPDVMHMRWEDVLFAHWPVAGKSVRPLVDPALAVDTWDGQESLIQAAGLPSPAGPPVSHFVRSLEVTAHWPETVESAA